MLRPTHFEIQADDPARCAKFYSEVFGWKIEQWAQNPYWMCMTGEKDTPGINGGILPRKGPKPSDGQAVNAYVCTMEVDNFDAVSEKITSAGGLVAVAKVKMGDENWSAFQGYFKDTEGNIFGIHQTIPVAKK